MLKEWDERCGDTNGLTGRDVHVVHGIRALHGELPFVTSKNTVIGKLIVFGQPGIGLSDPEVLFVIGGAVFYLVGDEGLDPHLYILKHLH